MRLALAEGFDHHEILSPCPVGIFHALSSKNAFGGGGGWSEVRGVRREKQSIGFGAISATIFGLVGPRLHRFRRKKSWGAAIWVDFID